MGSAGGGTLPATNPVWRLQLHPRTEPALLMALSSLSARSLVYKAEHFSPTTIELPPSIRSPIPRYRRQQPDWVEAPVQQIQACVSACARACARVCITASASPGCRYLPHVWWGQELLAVPCMAMAAGRRTISSPAAMFRTLCVSVKFRALVDPNALCSSATAASGPEVSAARLRQRSARRCRCCCCCGGAAVTSARWTFSLKNVT